MEPQFLTLARAHLLASLRGKSNPFETLHPWRMGWEFAAQHTLRVEQYTLKILARQQHTLSQRELHLLRLAAILHDIARLEADERMAHAARGAALARDWLAAQPELGLTPAEQARVVEMIAEHSNKRQPDPDLCRAVLKDADTLDEIGAISIFMSANWVERASPFFFQDLLAQLEAFEIPYCQQKMSILNTPGACAILAEKQAFIEGFIRQLREELEMSAPFERPAAE